jgi:hypothetical protein
MLQPNAKSNAINGRDHIALFWEGGYKKYSEAILLKNWQKTNLTAAIFSVFWK